MTDDPVEVTLPFRVIVPHTPTAAYHEWVYIGAWEGEPAEERRDSRGRHHPHAWRTWLRCICNNTDCAGRAVLGTWNLPYTTHTDTAPRDAP